MTTATTSKPTPSTKPKNTIKPNQNGSWADKIRISDSTSRFDLYKIPIAGPQKNKRTVTLPDDYVDDCSKWKKCIIGYFVSYNMPFYAARTIAKRAWETYGLEDTIAVDEGFLIFRFKDENGVHSVLEKGPWMFGGKAIILQQWHPHFIFDKTRISKVPVWVRLYDIPFPLWNSKGLSAAASMLGRPLSCDKPTYECTRLSYARVCVELDAALEIVHSFKILCKKLSPNPVEITAEYEWKPKHCPKCQVFGHKCKEEEEEEEDEEEEEEEEEAKSSTSVSGKNDKVATQPSPSGKNDTQPTQGAPAAQETSHQKASSSKSTQGAPVAQRKSHEKATSTPVNKEKTPSSGPARETTAPANQEQSPQMQCSENREAELPNTPYTGKFAVLDHHSEPEEYPPVAKAKSRKKKS